MHILQMGILKNSTMPPISRHRAASMSIGMDGKVALNGLKRPTVGHAASSDAFSTGAGAGLVVYISRSCPLFADDDRDQWLRPHFVPYRTVNAKRTDAAPSGIPFLVRPSRPIAIPAEDESVPNIRAGIQRAGEMCHFTSSAHIKNIDSGSLWSRWPRCSILLPLCSDRP